jgi:hypothetical protein
MSGPTIVEMRVERLPVLDQIMELASMMPEQHVARARAFSLAVEYLERYAHPAILVPASSEVAERRVEP